MEYLTALDRGNVSNGWQQICGWARLHLSAAEYNDHKVRVLFDAFRNSVAHRGIASGVWIDQIQGPTRGNRLTWRVTASHRRPAIEIMEAPGTLKKDSPWPCSYSHRVHIHLKTLAIDLTNAATAYAEAVETDEALQDNFYRCMARLYPR
jgi:hypothetical protein